MLKIPRFIVGSPESGAGKTTVALGLMGALKEAGLTVQPFKVGPDYIDPSLHSAVTHRKSRNLDVWLTSPRVLRRIFVRNAEQADVAVVEGVMGLFDGADAHSNFASTAHVARLLKTPVILVVDVSGMGRSVAAVVEGFRSFDVHVKIGGVILNRVSGPTHAEMVTQALSGLGVPVLGAIPHKAELSMPERHLGLVPAAEQHTLDPFLNRLTAFVGEHVDLKRIINVAEEACRVPAKWAAGGLYKRRPSRVRIGVAYDESFSFYYPENLELLEALGAEVIRFSPLKGKPLPENIDALYFGGGFPEVYARPLAQNLSLKGWVRKAAEDGMPIYAECGGLMYLCSTLRDSNERIHKMVDVLPGEVRVVTRLQALSYVSARVTFDTVLAPGGTSLRGHEFHYSNVDGIPRDARFAYKLSRGKGIRDTQDGWVEHNCLASYTHLHFAFNRKLPERFIQAASDYHRR